MKTGGQTVGFNSRGASGYSGYSGYSGMNGMSSASGYSGYSGYSGFSGYFGQDGVFGGDSQLYSFDTSVSVSPPSGDLRLNNSNPLLATEMYVSIDNHTSVDITTWLAALSNSNSTPKGRIRLVAEFDYGTFYTYDITGNVVNNTTYFTIPISVVTGSGSFSLNELVFISFSETGQSGTSGYSGYSGISGYSGYSGTSGYSGFSGYSGYSGTSGYSGFSGYSGISGYSGYSGTSGYSGYSGISGYSGYSGTSGYSGYSGVSGYSGYSGTSGYSGYSGFSGYSGAIGITGTQPYWFQDTASGISTYNDVFTTVEAGTEALVSTTANNNTVLIKAYASASTGLGTTIVPSGEWTFDFFGQVSSLSLASNFVVEIYTRTSGGSETLLFSTTSPTLTSTSLTEYEWSIIQPEFSCNLTDRLVIKVYGKTLIPLNTTIGFTILGTTHYSRVLSSFTPVGISGFSGYSGISGYSGYSGITSIIPIATAGGTVDAITATYTPALTLSDGVLAAFIASGANTSTTPTFSPNGLTAHTLTKNGGNPLVAGDLSNLGVYIAEYNLANTRWELLDTVSNNVLYTDLKTVVGNANKYITYDANGIPQVYGDIGFLSLSINGQGGVIQANSTALLAAVPSNGTIISWYVVGKESSGSIQIDLLRWNGSSYVSIIGSGNKPIISSAQRANASANGSWTSKTLAQFDELKWNVDSCTTFTQADVIIFYNVTS